MFPAHKLALHAILISLMGTLYPLLSFALTSDLKEKIHIVSDASSYNYKTGINSFEGHVTIDQGSTHITADRVTTKNNAQHKMQEATAYGLNELAHYWTLPQIGKPEIHAHARIIKFYPLSSNATLEKEVVVTQGENSFQGALILYNMNDQTITVPAEQQGRAVLVYNPDEKSSG